jgi:hypothetical protein
MYAQPRGYDPNRLFSPEEAQEDITVLQNLLYTYHPSVFRYTPKDSIDFFFRQITPQEGVTERQLRVSIRHVVSKIRCGHTNVLPSDNFIRYFTKNPQHHLPLEVHLINGKLFISNNLSQDTSLHIGEELLSVEDHTSTEILQQIYDTEISDAFSYTGKHVAVNDGFRFFNTLFYGTKPMYEVRVQDSTGKQRTLMLWEKSLDSLAKPAIDSLKTVKVNAINLLVHSPKCLLNAPSQRLRIDEKYPHLAILQIESFDNQKFSKFYKKVFQLLQKHQITQLVIDLRNNGGGKVQDANELLTYLLPQPFTYHFERKHQSLKGLRKYVTQGRFWLRITPSLFHCFSKTTKEADMIFHEWYHEPKTALQFKGKVFVLTNGGTFSAAATVAAYLKNLSNSTVIGTETGGSEAGTNALLFPLITLPHSKIQVRIPLYYVKYPIGIPDNRRGVLPHIMIQYTLQDVLLKRDLEMEEVYRQIGQVR